MSGALSLHLRDGAPCLLDASPLRPHALAGMTIAEIEALTLDGVPVGDLFQVTDGDRERLVFSGATGRLHRLGAGLDGGEIVVEGPVGAYAGAGARTGLIRVAGDADDALGGALPGAASGLNGATILVRGRAGARVGDRMRRGIVAVGAAGDLAGFRAVAGTILVEGACGRWPGFGLKRASLILGEAAELLPTFADCGSHDLLYLGLLWRSLARAGHKVQRQEMRVRRWAGDLATGGNGEVLQL